MEIHCKILAPQDNKQYRAVRLESLRKHPECFGSGYEAQCKLPKLYFEDLIERASQESVMIGAFADEALIGLCGLTPAEETGALEVIQMYVAQAYRGKAVGQQLLFMAKSILNNRAESKLVLTVFSDNHAAIRVYERFGFQRVGVAGNEILMAFEVGLNE